jgi:hypothetical protein
VEDEALVAMLIEDVLADAAFEVVGPFGQAAKALTAIADETVDAAILDVNLGGGERSYSVAHELSERGVPYMFLTGYGRAGIDPVTPTSPCCRSRSNPGPWAGRFTGCWREMAGFTGQTHHGRALT